MNSYLAAMLRAKVAGYYIPEIEDVYFKHEDFKAPHALALDFLL